ncbi:hypothetical protein SETIT_1G380600v2 [Setaria italica]|uniref:Uncharacterized protein n=1 Tax=Setaria italica TaxID=4555 RepID=A0A368PUI3_SETIT|nr:hypothetical protein SETIT_1G380600v2 [Setaria italica]
MGAPATSRRWRRRRMGAPATSRRWRRSDPPAGGGELQVVQGWYEDDWALLRFHGHHRPQWRRQVEPDGCHQLRARRTSSTPSTTATRRPRVAGLPSASSTAKPTRRSSNSPAPITGAGGSEYRIDGRLVSWDDYNAKLRSLGILS